MSDGGGIIPLGADRIERGPERRDSGNPVGHAVNRAPVVRGAERRHSPAIDEYQELTALRDALRTFLDLCPRVSDDDPIAPALADACRHTRVLLTVPK